MIFNQNRTVEDPDDSCIKNHLEPHSGLCLELLHVKGMVPRCMRMTVRIGGCHLTPRRLKGEGGETGAANIDQFGRS